MLLLTTLGALSMLNRVRERPPVNTLFAFRCVLDESTYDKHECPRDVQDLVREGYLAETLAAASPLFDRLCKCAAPNTLNEHP